MRPEPTTTPTTPSTAGREAVLSLRSLTRAGEQAAHGGIDSRIVGLLALVVGLTLAGCTPARREIDGDIVRRIRFEGNGGVGSGHNDFQLRSAMRQTASPPLILTPPFTWTADPAELDASTLQADSKRIEVWYAHHGWFDAQMQAWVTRRVRPSTDRLAGAVDVVGYVDPGAPSYVRVHAHPDGLSKRLGTAYVVPIGLDAAGRPDQRRDPVQTAIRAALSGTSLRPGQPFSLEGVQATVGAVTERLRDAHHAWASVTPLVDAWPDDHAVDIALGIEPGPPVRFGRVTIRGLQKVSEAEVRDTLTMATMAQGPEDDDARPPDWFSLKALERTRRNLYDTGLFSLVDIRPVRRLDATFGEVADLDIELREGKFRKVNVGAGVQTDYFVITPRINVAYQDRRLAGSGVGLNVDGGFGAVVGVTAEDDGTIPLFLTGSGEVALHYPWLLHRKLGIEASAAVTRDLQFGALPYLRFDTHVGLRYTIDDHWALTVGPRFESFDYTGLNDGAANAARLQFGTDFGSDAFRLLSVDLGVRYDRRDDPNLPRSGRFASFAVRQAIPVPTLSGEGLEEGFLYTRLDGDLRLYAPFRLTPAARVARFVAAGRLHGRMLIPWRGPEDALPYPDLAFLGGPNSLRGFRTNQVGPYDLLCQYDGGRPRPSHNNGEPYNVNRTYLPRGGAFAVEAAGELRYDSAGGLGVALFGDVGALARRVEDLGGPSATVVDESLRYGGGVGLRYLSPIGPIRFDVGLRPLFLEDTSGPRRVFDCNATDVLPRGYDLLSGTRAAREAAQAGTAKPWPVAINVLFGIGEAF
ncbi:MAG: hypothetical protein RLZZ383_797 [Pseudomonadota bacterium]|jgi:translocation and assembly module TamA